MGEGRKGPATASPAPPVPLPPQAMWQRGAHPTTGGGHSALEATGRQGGSRSARLPPVPRLRFEDWTYEDFQSVLDSEDEIEELSRTVVQVAKVMPGAPS